MLPAGKNQVLMEFAYDGGGLEKAGTMKPLLDVNQIGTGRADHTVPMTVSLDESLDVGCESGTTVAEDYTARTSKLNG